MNEDRLIEREYRYFIDIYSGADETKLKIANDLFWKAAFLKVQLYALVNILMLGNRQFNA